MRTEEGKVHGVHLKIGGWQCAKLYVDSTDLFCSVHGQILKLVFW